MAAVPETNDVYPLLGRPQDSLEWSHASYNISFPTYLGATFDASTTNLSYSIGDKLSVKLSFLSPITPSSTLRQSIPAAYLTVVVKGSTDLDLYIDVNGEWVSGNRGNEIRWELTQPGAGKSTETRIKTWKVRRSSEQLLTEFADRAEWGTLHFSAPVDVNHQAGVSRALRQHFSEKGSLNNEVDGTFRPIMDEEPVFAFSKSFKLDSGAKRDLSKREESVVFSFALVQDPVVQFASSRGLTYMKPFWASHFHSPDELIAYHYNDFNAASALARNYSDTLAKDAYESGSTDYRDIAALSARQVLGATQFSGTPENPIIFLKEISSNGNFQTVDVIFPAFPFFLYTNPKWLAYLLEPLLEHQLSGQYPNDYSMHDLGTHFPNATGHPDGRDEYMPVEECGNMLIMGLALVNSFRYDTKPAFVHAQVRTHDELPSWEKYSSHIDASGIDAPRSISARDSKAAEKWVGRSYRLWKQWTGYLVREALIPHNQLSTDDFAGWLANQTNLALKGIIGIRAMSEIADLVGEKEDAKFYHETANEYIEKWQEYGISRDKTHAKLAYTWYGSWTTIYNLYADSLLCFHIEEDEKGEEAGWLASLTGAAQKPVGNSVRKRNVFIPDEVYKIQSDWYHAVLQHYGLPLDSRHLYTKSDWEFFAAAVTSRKTRGEILERVATWVNETVTGMFAAIPLEPGTGNLLTKRAVTDRPLTDLYDTEGEGGFPDPAFFARPVVGGHFAFLALERACGGRAVEALSFLDERPLKEVDIQKALAVDGPELEDVWEEEDL
jgi:hypothetical protein